MPSKAILKTAQRAIPVANDVAPDSPYRADAHTLPPDGFSGGRRNSKADLLLFVELGTLELMIEGALGYLSAGEFARVPAGRSYGYRNAGSVVARVLSLAVREAERAARTVTITVAA